MKTERLEQAMPSRPALEERMQHALDAGSIATPNSPAVPKAIAAAHADRFHLLPDLDKRPLGFAPTLEGVLGFLGARRRPTPPELETIYALLGPAARAIPSPEQRAALPLVPFFEPQHAPEIFEAMRSQLWGRSIELLYHVNPEAPDLPGHTGIRVGTTIYEHLNGNAPPRDLTQGGALSAWAGAYWVQPHVYGFCIHATPDQLARVDEAFRTAPPVWFDYLSREGRDNCNHFVSSTVARAAPELGVVADRDPMHLFASLLWLEPKLAAVTLYSNTGTPVLHRARAGSEGIGPGFAFPEAGAHPAIVRLRQLAERKPVGWMAG